MNAYFDNIETGINQESTEILMENNPEWDLPIGEMEKFQEIKEQIKNKDFGRWGNARKKYLLENNLHKLVSLAQEMNIEEYLTELNQRATEKLRELEDSMKESSEKTENWLKTAQLYNSIRMTCQEIIEKEIIYPEEETEAAAM